MGTLLLWKRKLSVTAWKLFRTPFEEYHLPEMYHNLSDDPDYIDSLKRRNSFELAKLAKKELKRRSAENLQDPEIEKLKRCLEKLGSSL